VLSDEQRSGARRLFASHGYVGELTVARLTGTDELIFVLDGPDIDALTEGDALAAELQELLRRKVWIVPSSESWNDTEPF
jgi:hypothetical protein